MPVSIKYLHETKSPTVDEAIAWISPGQLDLRHWDHATKARFGKFLGDTSFTYGFLQGARCVQDFERYDGTEFWKLIKNEPQSTASNIVYINLSSSGFESQLAGIKYFKAQCTGEGKWTLTGASAKDNDNLFFTSVYWLPYAAGTTTSETRAAFENAASLDFFMTFELSGCRFAVNDSHVYHVAHDAGLTKGVDGKPLSAASSGSRSKSLAMAPGSDSGGRMRSLSITGDHEESFGYGDIDLKTSNCRAVVFGAKGASNRAGEPWTYKAFIFSNAAFSRIDAGKAWCVIFDKTRYAGDKLWA